LSGGSKYTAGSETTGDISGPEPEAITAMRRKTRTESMSADISETLSRMNLPQPERIFGPDEGESSAARQGNKGKQGVSAEDWDKIKLSDDVPEAVKEPKRMTHSRNASRVCVAIKTCNWRVVADEEIGTPGMPSSHLRYRKNRLSHPVSPRPMPPRSRRSPRSTSKGVWMQMARR
jgi:hypothetical protein